MNSSILFKDFPPKFNNVFSHQVIPNLGQGPVILQQPGTGMQFIIRPQQSPSPTASPMLNKNTMMIPGQQQGQTVLIHNPAAALQQQQQQQQRAAQMQQPMLRLVPTGGGQMQFQQIQTANGPTIIAVPSAPMLSFQPQIRGQQQQQVVMSQPVSCCNSLIEHIIKGLV
jgi:hypothetical protein